MPAVEQEAAPACEPPLPLGDADLLDWLAVSREEAQPATSALPTTDVARLFVDVMPLHAAPAGAEHAASPLGFAFAPPPRAAGAGHGRQPDEPLR